MPLRSSLDCAEWVNEIERHTLGVGVVEEQLHHVNVLGAGEGVTADTDDERLAKTSAGRLRDGLVREGARTGNNPCGPRQM